MKTFKQFIYEVTKYAKGYRGGGYSGSAPRGIYYHGSATGDLRGGNSGLHLGTKEAARQALNARIGHPLHGEWDGTRQYGQTKLAGKNTLKKRGEYVTGHNVRAPDHDYYPHEHPDRAVASYHKEGGDIHVEPHHTPRIRAYRIVGPMTNTHQNPHGDSQANGLMRRARNTGKAKSGYFYKNDGEDYGSISAVVPDASHIREV